MVGLILLSACVSTDKAVQATNDQIAQVNDNISQLEQSLILQFKQSCQVANQQPEAIEPGELEPVTTGPSTIVPTPIEKEIVYVERCSASEQLPSSSNDKLILGQVETVTLVKENLALSARIDTGAETSSLGVYNLTEFERDSKKWVRYSLSNDEQAQRLEYPVFNKVKIKQQSNVEAEARLVIKLNISLGGQEYLDQAFNLANRRHLEYQILIGRNFLRDIAVVDVSSRYLLGRN